MLKGLACSTVTTHELRKAKDSRMHPQNMTRAAKQGPHVLENSYLSFGLPRSEKLGKR